MLLSLGMISGKTGWQSSYLFALFMCLLFLGIMPIAVYFSAKKLFKTNQRVQEKIVYEFTDDKITVTGETFSSELTWEKFYKILELKHFVLLYQSVATMNIISKSAFGEQIMEFRNLVKTKNVKAKLLKK